MTASSLLPQRSRSHQIAWQRAVGDEAEQLEAGGKLRGGKRQLRGVGQCRTGSRIARKR